MKIKFLGTGASEGTPAIFCECEVCKVARERRGKYIRTRAGMMIDERLLIDFSPDLYVNSIKYDIHLSAMKDLLFTHSHGDHFFPMDLTARASFTCKERREDVLNAYGGEPIIAGLKEHGWQKNQELTRNLQYTMVKSGETFQTAGGYSVTPYATKHMLDEECYIFLIEKDGKSYLHCHDSGEPYDWALEAMAKKGVKLDALAMDCTYGLIQEEYGGHMNVNQNIRVKAKMEKLGLITEKTLCYATHIAHCGGDVDELEAKANANGILVAYDGLEIEI